MLKSLTLFILSFSLFSNVHIGDSISFDFTDDGTSGTGKTQITAYDETKSTYTINNEITTNGVTETEEVQVEDAWSHEYALILLELCTELTGKLEQVVIDNTSCLLYTSPSPRDRQKSRMPSSA